MRKKSEKEYQHYVPKFYLRFFSNNSKSVGTYIFKNNKYIPIASLDSIGGSKYLYGEDGEIENWFSELEGKWNIILKKIIDTNSLNINQEEYTYLLMFIYLSEARSKTSADIMNKFINEVAITTYNIDPKNEKKYSYKENIAKFAIPNLNTIEIMPEIIPLLFDLNLVLIVNETDNQFITSDCIVNKYNQFLLEKGYKRGFGYGTCGLECIVPISPKHALCLFDNYLYDAKIKNHIITIRDSKEITKLNKLFLYNSDKNIFFNENIQKSRLDVLLKSKEKLSIEENTLFKSDDGEFLMKLGSRCIDKNFDFKFIKTKEKAKKIRVNNNAAAPIRTYAQKLDEENNKDQTPENIIEKISGKKFYLQNKE